MPCLQMRWLLWRSTEKQQPLDEPPASVHKPVEAVWETVEESFDGNTIHNCFVESAYPARHDDGSFSIVRVITHRIAQDGNAAADVSHAREKVS